MKFYDIEKHDKIAKMKRGTRGAVSCTAYVELYDMYKALVANTAWVSVDDETLKEFCKLNGALQVWRSWRDTMLAQGREVKAEYMEMDTLPQRDIELDAQIAYDVIYDFIFYMKTHPHPTTPEDAP